MSADKEASEMLYYSAYELPLIIRTAIRALIGICAASALFLCCIAMILGPRGHKYRDTSKEKKDVSFSDDSSSKTPY